MRAPQLVPSATTATVPVRPMLRAYSVEVKTSDARQFCALVAENGRYRYEDRYQRSGKAVSTRISTGVLKSDELQRLRTILDNPALAKIQHREPRGSAPVPILGDMLNLTIARPAGEQNIILSSRFGRQFGIFYAGDADAAVARDLTKFLKGEIGNNTGPSDKSARNDCTELP